MSTALPDHRRRQILQRLSQDGSVRVSDLSRKMKVAEETIRRDLKLLDGEGVLVRTHGGAVPSAPRDGIPFDVDVSFGQRLTAKAKEKRAIAREAVKLIRPRQVIALDGSTTAWELARLLPRTPLTVVTNSLVITNLLTQRPDVRIVCTGGHLDTALQIFEGLLADETLSRLNIDVAFFSCRGIDAKRGYSDPSEPSALYKKRLIELAEQSVLLADHTKFDARSMVYFATAGEINRIITDTGVPASALKPFEKLGVDCVSAALRH